MADDFEGTQRVGYCKPPTHTQFKKGQSGNPKGRPKKVKNITLLVEEELKRRIDVRENGRRKRISKLQAIIKTLVNSAIGGDIRSLKLIIEEKRKTEPAPVQKIPIELLRDMLDRALAPEDIPDPPHLIDWEEPSKTAAHEEIQPTLDTRATPDEDDDEILKLIDSPNFTFDLEKARAELARRDSAGAPKPQPSASMNPLTGGKPRRP
jgi:hypothetical protein